MAQTLSSFYRQNAKAQDLEVKFVVSDRFLDEKGMAIPFILKPVKPSLKYKLSDKYFGNQKVYKDQSTEIQKLDSSGYAYEMIEKTVIFPNLADAELQNSYGVMGARSLLDEMLTPSEFERLMHKVNEINSAEAKINDQVDEVKN